MNYYVYILQSQKDGTYYVGQTKNLDERLQRHNEKREKSTKFKSPYKIIRTEIFESRIEALRREKQIKSYKGGNAFKKLTK